MSRLRLPFSYAPTNTLFAIILAIAMALGSQVAEASSRLAQPYAIEKVQFQSGGDNIVGRLLKPSGAVRGPAVVVLGPVAFVKEQSPTQYATRLVRSGFSVLIFDPRYHGESEGQPRRFENGKAKVADLRAAVDYLVARSDISAEQIFALGICQGVNWVMEAAAQDSRIRGISLVAGHYLTPETATLYLGGQEVVRKRISDAERARKEFETTGKVNYIPIVGAENALLKAKLIEEWYTPWETSSPWFKFRGGWENRITQMSEADIWGWDVGKTARRIETPVLMVHADHAASGSKIPRNVFEALKSKNKKLVWLESGNQLQFYEDPLIIDRAAHVVATSFAAWLRSSDRHGTDSLHNHVTSRRTD